MNISSNKEKYNASSLKIDEVFGKIDEKNKLIPIYLIKSHGEEKSILTTSPKWGMLPKHAQVAELIHDKYKDNPQIINNIWAINRMEYIDIKEIIKNDLSENTTIGVSGDFLHSSTNGGGKWETIIEALLGKDNGCSSHMTDYKLIANNMHLVLIDSSNTPTILFSLTIVRDAVDEYFGLANTIGNGIDPKYLRFFIHPLVDSKDSPWPSIRTNYRKHIKPLLKDIKIIECDNIQSIICNINNAITGNTVKEVNENLDKFSEKFFDDLKKTTSGIAYAKRLNELSIVK